MVALSKPAPKPMRESGIKASIRLDLGTEPDLTLWSNAKWEGVAESGEYVCAGLPDGSPDLIGILVVAAQIDGRTRMLGRFFALEVKKPGAYTKPERVEAQARFAESIRRMGGFCAEVESTEEARAALLRARRGGDR
jgi:hypothetical protein